MGKLGTTLGAEGHYPEDETEEPAFVYSGKNHGGRLKKKESWVVREGRWFVDKFLGYSPFTEVNDA